MLEFALWWLSIHIRSVLQVADHLKLAAHLAYQSAVACNRTTPTAILL